MCYNIVKTLIKGLKTMKKSIIAIITITSTLMIMGAGVQQPEQIQQPQQPEQTQQPESREAQCIGFSFEYPGDYIMDESDPEFVAFGDKDANIVLIAPKAPIDNTIISEADKKKIQDNSGQYVDWCLSQLVRSYKKGLTLNSKGVTVIDVPNDTLVTKTVKIDEGSDWYFTIYLDKDTTSRFFTLGHMAEAQGGEEIYKQVVSTVKYVGE